MLNPIRRIGLALGLIGVTVAVAASPAAAAPLPQGSEPVELDPAEFSTRIDNQYFPLVPGDRHVYRETDGKSKQRVVLSVSHRTKLIANGITGFQKQSSAASSSAGTTTGRAPAASTPPSRRCTSASAP